MVEGTTSNIQASQFRQTSLNEGLEKPSIAPKAEGPAPEKAVEETKREPLSPRLLALAKREKALRARDLALKQREAEVLKTQEEFKTPRYIAKDQFQEKFKGSPLEALQELGLDYNAISETLLTQAANPTDFALKKLQAKLEALEAKQSESLKTLEERDHQQIESTKKSWENEAKLLADSSPEFELLKEQNAYDKVVSLIWSYGEETGEMLSVKEAAAAVEEELFEDALKLAKAKKIQEKIAATLKDQEASPSIAEGAAPKLPNSKGRISVREKIDPEKPRMETLTQSHTTSSQRRLSKDERFARAVAALNGQLPA